MSVQAGPIDVAKLRIVSHPAEVLRRKADPIAEVNDTVRAVAERMIELMDDAEGIGLAAPQIGLSWRMFVVDVPEDDDRSADGPVPSATKDVVVYINPVIVNPLLPLEPYEEGCLSLPGIRGDVIRPTTVTIKAIGLDGKPFEQTATGLLARCWQHEYDHLDGVLIIDRMTQMSRIKNRAAVRSLERGE